MRLILQAELADREANALGGASQPRVQRFKRSRPIVRQNSKLLSEAIELADLVCYEAKLQAKLACCEAIFKLLKEAS